MVYFYCSISEATARDTNALRMNERLKKREPATERSFPATNNVLFATFVFLAVSAACVVYFCDATRGDHKPPRCCKMLHPMCF